MQEICILKTVSLHSTRGVVHIESMGYDTEDHSYIEFDARQLLEDLPSLYTMAQQAIKQDEEYQTQKFVEFKRKLAEDWKGKRGRKT